MNRSKRMYTRVTIKKDPPKQYGKGRVCKKFGCKKRLSVYNSEQYCHVHRKEFRDKLNKWLKH